MPLIESPELHVLPLANAVLWRYMDFAKLVNLLESEALHFVRADMFEDPLEGAWSEAGITILNEQSQDVQPGYGRNFRNPTTREMMFVSCWHRNDHESAAMWRLYSQDGLGVAIKCSYSKLANALNQSPIAIFASMVQYSDYATNPIAMWGGWTWPFLNKRLSFEHEREFRALFHGLPHFGDDATIKSHGIAIVPSDLIDAVVVHPQAQTWFKDTVRLYIRRRFGDSIRVENSPLYEGPLS